MKPEWIIDGRCYGAEDLSGIAHGVPGLAEARSVLIQSRDPALFFAVLNACESNQAYLFAVPAGRLDAEVDAIADSAGVELVIRGDAVRPLTRITHRAARGEVQPGICIFTTGTTGGPKGVGHTWQSIAASARFVPSELAGSRWWLAYQMTSYAGLQVFFSARRSGGTLVVETGRDPATIAQALVRHQVSIISATPTYWRSLLQGWPETIAKPSLQRATLGGEVITQETLDLVSAAFQPQRIIQIYASSEAGTAIVVSDGLAGFPVDGGAHSGGAEFQVRNGELWVRSPAQMTGYWNEKSHRGNWIATGDLVEEREGRYYFCGRVDGRINAGGAKVNPERVEAALERLPMVAAAVVYGKPSPIVGNLLAADIQWQGAEPFDPQQIRRALSETLAPHEIPPFLRAVETIAVSENGKKRRA